MFRNLGIIKGALLTEKQRKHLARRLDGKSVLEWVVRQMTDCELVDGVVVLADEGTAGDLVNGLTPIDVPVHRSGAQDTIGLLENVLGQFASESCVFIGADWPFVDPALIDQLVRTAHAGEKCDYAAYQFTNEVFSVGRPYGLFPEWYCSSSILKAAKKLGDAVYRSLPGSFFLDHQKEYSVELLPVPAGLDQGSIRFSFEDEEDWDNIVELHDALSLEVLDSRKIGGILRRRLPKELVH
ncbi:hypothetical protein FACS189427_00550 [Planctomycetales bacterium]|nr:hypothetical protein FACS189427_00550 [Planctomycetales bacterium]